MSASIALSPQEALARDLIVERVAAEHARHRLSRHRPGVRRQARAAVLLRRLAERLDPVAAPGAGHPQRSVAARPWQPQVRPTAGGRRAPSRHC